MRASGASPTGTNEPPAMIRRVPVLPTLLVTGAVALMLALGFWQLRRAEQKEALLARYAAVEALPGAVAFPLAPAAVEGALYRRSALDCARVTGMRETAGRSALGQPGWAVIARCQLAGGGEAEVALGWSRAPGAPDWTGGRVTGTVAPAGEGARLVADPAQAGLAALARPDPRDLPNNHLAYAVQWFLFALTAIVVFVLALRRRSTGD